VDAESTSVTLKRDEHILPKHRNTLITLLGVIIQNNICTVIIKDEAFLLLGYNVASPGYLFPRFRDDILLSRLQDPNVQKDVETLEPENNT
jgi:hypothetical protein